jgi:hypothetical protein
MIVPFLLYQTYVFITYGHVFVKTVIGSGFQYVEAKGLQHKTWDPEEIAKAFLLGHYPLTSIFLLVVYSLMRTDQETCDISQFFYPHYWGS